MIRLLGEKTTTPLQPLKQAIEKPKHEFLKNFKSISESYSKSNECECESTFKLWSIQTK